MAPTKSAGRVSIRVLPDSSRFREDLKKTLDRIEDTMKVSIQVNPVFDRKQLADLKRQIEALKITIKPDIDLTVPQEDIERIKAQVEAMSPEVDVDLNLNTAGAAARISTLTRDRVVMIHAILHKTAVNNFTKHLAAIAGASYITSEVRKGMDFLRTIDIHAVGIAKKITVIGGVVAAATGLLQTVWALGDGLIQMTGLLTVAPALLSSMGIAAAVFIVAIGDMKEVLADLGPAFTTLADQMSSDFWNEAAKPIREMVNHLMPTLNEKMRDASVSMGKLTGQIANSYKEHVTIEKFGIMFDRVVESMDTVRGAVDPIIEAFTILGMHGTKYLDRLSKSIVGVSEDFRDWLKVSEGNGDLEKWTENGILAFKNMGGIIKGVWNVFGALNDAMKAAGGPTLATLHQGLDNLASMMDSEMFQRSLTAVFRGVNHALVEIGQAIIDVGPRLADLAPTIERAFWNVGATISTLIGYFGEVMSHPMVRGGLHELFQSIEDGVGAMAPAMEPFSLALGSLLKLLGTVLENVAILVTTIMVEWGPSLQSLSDTFDTLATPLREMLETVVKALTPAIETLINDAIIPLLEWIRDSLIPAMEQFATDSGPELERMMSDIGIIIQDYLIPALDKLLGFFVDAEGGASDFKKTLDSLHQLINDPLGWTIDGIKFAGKSWTDGMWEDAEKTMRGEGDNFMDKFGNWLIDANAEAGEGIWNFIKGVDDKFVEFWGSVDFGSEEGHQTLQESVDNLVGGFQEGWDELARGFDGWTQDLGKWWDDLWGGREEVSWEEELDASGMQMATAGIDVNLGELGESFSTWWDETSTGWNDFWTGFGDTVREKWDGVKTWFGEKIQEWKDSFTTWMSDMGIDTENGWTGIKDSIINKFTEAKDALLLKLQEMGLDTDNAWTLISSATGLAWDTVKMWIQTKFQEAKDWLFTKLAEMGIDVDSVWSTISSATALAWETVKTWIGTKFQEAKDALVTKLQEMGIDTDSAWSIITSAAAVAWEAVKQWVLTKFEEAKQSLKTKLAEMGIDVDSGWNTVKNITSILWERIKQAVRDKLNEIKGLIPGWANEFGNNIRNGFENAKIGVQNKMTEMRNGIRTKINETIEDVRTLPNRILETLKGIDLFNSGWNMMVDFQNGLNRAGDNVVNAAKNILSRVRSYFPFSPAKIGPFSGTGYTTYSGAALMSGFAEGIESKMATVTNATRSVTKGVAGQLNGIKLDSSLAVNGSGESTGGNMTVNVYNPIAEPTSRTLARKSSTIKLGGAIG